MQTTDGPWTFLFAHVFFVSFFFFFFVDVMNQLSSCLSIGRKGSLAIKCCHSGYVVARY